VKHKKVIEIRDPRLRKIRNNFRLLWISATQRIYDKNLGKQEALLKDRMNSYEMDQFRKSEKDIQRIRALVDRSICKCPVCRKSDRDMIFNPITKVWFCVHCYELNREYYKYTEDAKFYP